MAVFIDYGGRLGVIGRLGEYSTSTMVAAQRSIDYAPAAEVGLASRGVDVFAFGVVVAEALTGLPASWNEFVREEKNLQRARCQNKLRLHVCTVCMLS
jgi:hypothetical protein